ncbi:MAG TPA: cupin domain-containing protein [Solirubrobacteraceae bacterium]|nr:cupin domain-containing protein [Solirubrobacteraceae bacterium]
MKRIDLSDPTFEYDETDPAGFRAGMVRPGPQLGAQATGATLYELPPGEALCPYHYELAEEEWLLVVAGRVTVRTPDETAELGPMELAFFPPAPEGAHQVLNESSEPVRVLMWSQVVYPAVTVYPDSDKIGVYTRSRADNVMVKRSSSVPYYTGESR